MNRAYLICSFFQVNHSPTLARVGHKEEHFGPGKPPSQGPALLDALNVEDIAQRISGRAAGCHHGHGKHILDRPSGARIHDVGVPNSTEFEELLGAPGY